jgi:hypothetical protein
MQCPACQTETCAKRCPACGKPLTRKIRRRAGNEDGTSPYEPQTVPCNRSAATAWHVAVLGMIPVLGLLLGPAAVLWGALTHCRCKADPQYTARSSALAAVAFGIAITITNWLGLGLIVFGMRSLGACVSPRWRLGFVSPRWRLGLVCPRAGAWGLCGSPSRLSNR